MKPAPFGSEETPIAVVEPVLSMVWPNELRTLFLRACTGDGAAANLAWQRFADVTGGPKAFIERDLSGLKGLLPLVHSAARRNGFDLDQKLWTYLRSATLREELRYGAYRTLCGRVLEAFTLAAVPVIALKACALAETVYEVPAQRHCHAIDLLVPDGALEDVARIVQPLGFRPARLVEAPPGCRRGFKHESGLPLVVHTALFDPPVYRIDMEPLWAASSAATVASVPVRVLSAPHNLLHVLTAAFHDPRRDNLRWACDAWHLFREMSRQDWGELVRLTQSSGLELPVVATLRYLSGALDMPVPDDVLRSLESSAGQSGRPAIEAALSAAIGGLSELGAIWFHQPRTPGMRRMVLQFLVWPSAQYLRWRFGTATPISLAFYFVCRPLAYAGQRVWWRALRLPGLNRFTRYHRIAAELEKLRA